MKDIKQQLIDDNYGLIISIISKYTIAEDDRDDVISEATIGLLKAHDRFDPNLGYKFSTFAYSYIQGHILDYFNEKEFYDSLDEEIGEDFTLMDTLESDQDIEQEYIEDDLTKYRLNLLNKILSKCSERDQEIFSLYMKGYTNTMIAEHFNFNVSRATQKINMIERYVKNKIEDEERRRRMLSPYFHHS